MTVECPICGKSLKDGRGLSGHMKFAHNKNPEDVKDYKRAIEEGKVNRKVDEIRELYDKLMILRKQRAEAEEQREEQEGFFDALFGSDKVERHIIRAYEAEEKRLEQEIKKLAKEVEQEAGASSDEDDDESGSLLF